MTVTFEVTVTYKIMGFLIVLIVLHFVAPLVAVLSARVFEGKKRPLRGWAILYLIVFYQAAALNVGLFLSIPLIVLLLITGPGAFIGFIVSIFGLGLYFVERVVNYDVPNYSFHGDDSEALFMVGLFVFSLLCFAVLWKMQEYEVMDRFPGWLGDQFRRPLIHLEQQLKKTERG